MMVMRHPSFDDPASKLASPHRWIPYTELLTPPTVPVSPTFFTTLAGSLNNERPADATTDRVFVALKGPTRGGPLSADGLDEVLGAARDRAGLAHGTCHELRHTCFTRLREAGMAIEAVQAQAGHRSIASTRIYLHLSADWLADEYRRATDAIEANATTVEVTR
jgi:integrase